MTLTFDPFVILIEQGRHFHPKWSDVSTMYGEVVSVFIECSKCSKPTRVINAKRML